MTSPKKIPVNIRPTLILGLGGTGYKIALQIKARLEEELGPSSHYNDVIKFICFDTANENISTRQPNHPDREVRMSPEREFMRISDVPLHELMRSRDSNPAIDAIFPEVLQSTQIDQGAQQIRRLGRIALFYHYPRVRKKLLDTIQSIRSVNVMGRLGVNEDKTREVFVTDRNRLRVYVICSICGGTGSGTFIDMAYMARHIAVEAGLSSEQSVDVVGVLLLPEAFPEIETTGASRIRANAYAALMDIEYYNQAASAEQALYDVTMPGGEHLRMRGGPFQICYLVGNSSVEGTMGGLRTLAPILGNALSTLIMTRLGEQTDATFDNIRPYLTTYFEGYRASYSALGIAEIIYPELWMRQEFGRQLKQQLIYEIFLRGTSIDPPASLKFHTPPRPQMVAIQTAAAMWVDNAVKELEQAFTVDDTILRTTTAGLQNVDVEAGTSNTPLADLIRAYRTSMQLFGQTVVNKIDNQISEEKQAWAARLRKNTRTEIDRILNVTSVREDDMTLEGGLEWTRLWLIQLEETIRERLQELQEKGLQFTDSALKEYVGAVERAPDIPIVQNMVVVARVKEAAKALDNAIRGDALGREVNRATYDVLNSLRIVIEAQRREVQQAINRLVSYMRTSEVTRPPNFPPTTQFVLDLNKQREFVMDTHLAAKDFVILFQALRDACGVLSDGVIDGDVERYLFQLTAFCESWYDQTNTDEQVSETSNVFDILNRGTEGDDENQSENIRQRNTLLRNLAKQASPLLVYNHGLLHGQPTRNIKVIGTENVEDGNSILNMEVIERADTSIVETGDHSRIQMLITNHGIPAIALSRFETYRRYYMQYISQREAIFHLDNERETSPHDPGSQFFVDLADVEALFAQALAYGWIEMLANTVPEGRPLRLFAFRQSFFYALRDMFDDHVSRIENRIQRLRSEMDDNRERTPSERHITQNTLNNLEKIKHQLATKFNSIVLVDRVNFPGFAYEAQKHDHDYYTFKSAYRNANLLPTELHLMLAFIEADSVRAMPLIFIEAFEKHYETAGTSEANGDSSLNEMQAIREFLTARNVMLEQGISGKQDRELIWSKPGHLSYELEHRIVDLLITEYRLRKRTAYKQRRKTTYVDPFTREQHQI